MRKFVTLAIAPLAFAVSMAATAAPGDMPSAAQRAAMQRDLGMTSAQLSQYLKVERPAAQQSQTLAASQGRNYAGSWIERGSNASTAWSSPPPRRSRSAARPTPSSVRRATASRSSTRRRVNWTCWPRRPAARPPASTAGRSTCGRTA